MEKRIGKLLGLLVCTLLCLSIWAGKANAEIAFDFDTSWSGSYWDESHSIYTTDSYYFGIAISGLAEGNVYRAMLMGQTLQGEAFSCPRYVNNYGDGTGSVSFDGVVEQPGTYKNLVLAVAGNGEFISLPFTYVQETGNPEEAPKYGAILSGTSYHLTSGDEFVCPQDDAIRFDVKATGTLPVQIITPTEGAVYSGYPGVREFIPFFAWKEDASVNVQIVHEDTGNIVAASSNLSGVQGDRYGRGMDFPEDWEPGKYQLRLLMDGEELQTVSFFLELEEDPTPLFAAAHPGVREDAVHTVSAETEEDMGLRFDFNRFSGTWSEDWECLTLDGSSLQFKVRGLKQGVPYFAAMLGVDYDGEPFCKYIDIHRYSSSKGEGYCNGPSTLPGTYENITLAVIGGGESIAHTFTYCLPAQEDETYDYFSGYVYGDRESEIPYSYDGGYYDGNESASGIVQPADGAVYRGHDACNVIEVRFSGYEDCQYVKLLLTSKETGETIAAYEQYAQYCWGGTSLRLATPPSSGEYTLTMMKDDAEVDSVDILIENAGNLEEQFMALMPEAASHGVDISEDLASVDDSFETIETDAFMDFIRYRYDAKAEDSINSFAICCPNVKAMEVETDRKDLLHTANWTFRDMYLFQQRDMAFYGNAQILRLSEVNDLFDSDFHRFDFAAGKAVDEDGTIYEWMPVYFRGADGSIRDDKVYLFVYVAVPGADTAYLDSLNYYHPDFYHDYHTKKMLITDQTVVAQLLRKIQGDDLFQSSEEKELFYPSISLSEQYVTELQNGPRWYLNRMQDRLKDLGYLREETSSKVCDQATVNAIRAFESANGLASDGIADSEMQRILFDSAKEKTLLSEWIARNLP